MADEAEAEFKAEVRASGGGPAIIGTSGVVVAPELKFILNTLQIW